jgi:hypothetical protein
VGPPRTPVEYLCDTSEWPLVVISAPPGCDPDCIDAGSFYRHTDMLLANGEPFLLLHDIRHSGRLSAERRRRFANYVETKHEEVTRCLVAYAALVGTDWQRGLLTAVLWFLTPPRPQRAFSDPLAARAWLLGQLAEAGVLARAQQG